MDSSRKKTAKRKAVEALRQYPSPPQIDAAPELAMIYLLETNLEMLGRTLVASHPQLCNPECPDWVKQASSLPSTKIIVSLSNRLLKVLNRYQKEIISELNAASTGPDDISF